MSWKAAAHIKEIVTCPNGERITRSEKLLALVLADYHQMGEPTYPSIPTLASDALLDERQARRLLNSLERKGVLARQYPKNQGRGANIFYRFPGIEEADKKEVKTTPLPETQKGGQKGDISKEKRRAEGGQKGDILPRAYKEERKQELKTNTNTRTTEEGPAAGFLADELRDESHFMAKSVINQTGLSGNRIYEAIRAQAEFELRNPPVPEGSPPNLEEARETYREVLLEGMVGAWVEYENCSKANKLRFGMMGAEKFYGEGKWKSPRLWGLKTGMKAYEEVPLGTKL